MEPTAIPPPGRGRGCGGGGGVTFEATLLLCIAEPLPAGEVWNRSLRLLTRYPPPRPSGHCWMFPRSRRPRPSGHRRGCRLYRTHPPPTLLRKVMKACRCFPSWEAPPSLLLPSPSAWSFLVLSLDVAFSYLAECLFDQCLRHDCVAPDRKSIKVMPAESSSAQQLSGVGDPPCTSRAGAPLASQQWRVCRIWERQRKS